MAGQGNGKRHTESRWPGGVPAIRYPERAIIDSLLPAMVERRSAVLTAAPALVHVWGFTGTGGAEEINAAGVTEFSPDDAPVVAGSPILEIAARMMTGMGGRLWGFGLAYRSLAEATVREVGGAAQSESTARLQDRPTAEEVWVATIFDARGHEYTQLRYLYLPDLEPIGWDADTLDRRSTIDDWFDRAYRGIVSAHVWAAALALDATRNHTILGQLQRHLRR
ncbi:hypothetical protein [Nocardia transvalensis]|uniref:hypothetical protein n=1 Tax=Nocardia transvalensis TaxID=37333 RepID=UPI001895E9A9|nr:hypothetical protein [Nocardia transvalensis]MBF6330215.1 hypothetical protein [Nocardia transvalensis]